MRLIELRLKNLNSLKGEWYIDFADPAFINEGIFAITGQTGAGKTTILDAICLALYGETPRINSISKSSNEVMTRQTADCFAEVVIDLNGTQYRCRWGQRRAYGKPDGNLQDATHEVALINAQTDDSENSGDDILESKLSRTKEKIIELTRMDFDQFTRSILLAQGSFSAFLKAKADERADILEKITGTDIYATISTHVFEKKRSEEEVLSKLQYGLDGLILLTVDEEAVINEELKTYQLAQTEQQQKYQQFTEQIQWLDAIDELQNKRATYQNDLSKAEQSKQDFIPDAKRLDAATKALELESQFGHLSRSRDTTKRLFDEQQAVAVKLPTQQSDLQQAQDQLNHADQTYKQAQLALKEALPKITETRELDARIKQQSQRLQDNSQRQDTLSASVQRLTQEIKSHQTIAARSESQLASTAQYLAQYSELKDIDTDIATFENNGRRLKTLLQDNTTLAQQKTVLVAQTEQYRLDKAKLISQQQEQETSIAAAQKQFSELQQQQQQLLATKSLADHRAEQQQIEHLISQIDPLIYSNQQLSTLTTQIKNLQSSKPSINEALATLKESITNTEKSLQQAKDKRQEKQMQLTLLQKVASLEHYINELENGQPCPLCGALEHPNANKESVNETTEPSKILSTQQQLADSDTMIESLDNELSKLKISFATHTNQLEHQQQQLVPLITQASMLSDDIAQMSDTLTRQDERYNEAVAARVNPIKDIGALTQKLKRSLNTNAIDTSAIDVIHSITARSAQTKQQLLEHKDRVKAALTDYETLAESIAKLEKELALFEKNQYQLASEISLLDNDDKLNQQRLGGLQDNTKAHFLELQTLIADVLSIINKYTASYSQSERIFPEIQLLKSSIDEQSVLDNTEIEQQLAALRQYRSHMLELKQSYNQEKQQQQTLTTELSRLTTQIETKQAQLDKESTELDTLSQSIAEQTKAVVEFQKDRKALFAEKEVDKEEDRLRLDVEQAKTAQSRVQRQADSAEQLLQIAEQQLTRLASELLAAQTTLKSQDDIFQQALASSDFATEADFVSARLSQNERNHLSEQRQQIDYHLKQAKSLLQQTEQALADQKAHPLTLENKECLLDEQQQAQSKSNRLIESIGAMMQKLKDNEAKKGNQQSQLKAIAEQKQNLQVWRQLNELIGSSSGKKFRAFAQGLTFDIMVNHANTQLHKMSDRYLLARDNSNPLELNVIDNYQGGEIRSTKNLSGGEGFIISLALALGLSQMASQNIRVDSLFLDEGFGTLDEESLDIALDTLTSLQQEGKLIGVISHVQALKERILTQIQVKKLSGGFSQISGQGCYYVANS